MSRLRIRELIAKRRSMTKTSLAAAVFHDDDCSAGRKLNRIVSWDKGRDFGPLDPKYILRLARELKVTKINELFEDDGA